MNIIEGRVVSDSHPNPIAWTDCLTGDSSRIFRTLQVLAICDRLQHPYSNVAPRGTSRREPPGAERSIEFEPTGTEATVTETENGPDSEPAGSPDELGRFELLTKFATGGMAELYLARERGVAGLERVVVIKRLLPHLSGDPSSVDMFLREARLVARLNHPNVVQTYELGEEKGEYFLAMEYLHGSTLRELQSLAEEEHGHLPLEIALTAIDQGSRGLHAAHELRDLEGNLVGLIHRDVSPQNLMLTVEGYVKLLDFGVAKAAEGKEATYSGNIKGKFSYMSPEQLHREQLDRRSDIFALGIVTWEMCVGERLFDRDGELGTMQAITEEAAPPPSERNPSVPRELDAVVLKALEKDRSDRYQTVEQFRQDLIEVGEAFDLLSDENTLAQFVRDVAGEQLEARNRTLQDALDRSLTADERARLRHERHGPGSQSGLDQPDSGGEPTAVERPSDRGPSSTAPNTPSSPRHGDSLPFGEPGADTTEPDSGPANLASGPPETVSGPTNADIAYRWQVGLTVGAVLLLAASAVIAFWGRSAESSDGEAAESETMIEPEISGEPLEFGVTPIATESVLRKEFEPIERYLERSLQRPINVVVADSYEETATKLRNGEFDVAMLTPLLFVRTRRAESGIQPLAIREFDGSIKSNGLLLIRSGSQVSNLADLRGQTFCFTDENSTTGNFLPRVYLRREGFEPRDFIGRVHWSGNHLQALKDLIAEKCEVAATYSGSYLTADEHELQTGKFRQLAVTGDTPSDTITGRPGLPKAVAEKFQEVLFQFDPDEHLQGDPVGKTLKLTGFQKPEDEDYADLEQAVREHGDILERFDFPGSPAGEEEEASGEGEGDTEVLEFRDSE